MRPGLSGGSRGAVSAQALGPSAAQSTFSRDAATMATTTGTCTVTFLIKDRDGVALAGVTPVLTVDGTGNTITQPGASDAQGMCVGSFTTTQAATKTISATVNGRTLATTATCVTTTTNDCTSVTSCSPATGSTGGGTAVTITVVGATGTPTVLFDADAATSVVVVNSTTITCVTPAHAAGAVAITVGTAAPLAAGFTFSVLAGDGPGANEPVGYTEVSSNPFDAKPPSGSADAYGYIRYTDGTYLTIGTTDPGPNSPNNFLRYTFPKDYVGGDSPEHYWIGKPGGGSFGAAVGGTATKLYMRIAMRVSSNFTNNGGNNTKFVYESQEQGNNHFINLVGYGDDNFRIGIWLQDSAVGEWFTPTISKGVWHDIEILQDAGTAGGNDGKAYVWVDGVSQTLTPRDTVADNEHIPFFKAATTPRWLGLYVTSIYPGGKTVPAEQSYDIDHWYISVKA